MLILLLLVGLVVGSPLPEFEDQPVSSISDGAETAETKSLLHTVPFTPPKGEKQQGLASDNLDNPPQEVQDIEPVSITSPTMFNQQGGAHQLHQENPIKNAEFEKGSKEFHVTSEVRTVSFQINKKLHSDSDLPPLIFAQQPPEINLEPTEVEAPGTTPTTVSMITESSSTLTVPSVPFLEESFSPDNLNEGVSGKVVIIESKDIKPKMKSPVVYVRPNVSENFETFPQQDDPRTLMIESYPTLGETKSSLSKADSDSSAIKKDHFIHPTAFAQNNSSVKNQQSKSSELETTQESVETTSANLEQKVNLEEKKDLPENVVPISDDLIVPITETKEIRIKNEPKISFKNESTKTKQEIQEVNLDFESDSVDAKTDDQGLDDPIILELRPKQNSQDLFDTVRENINSDNENLHKEQLDLPTQIKKKDASVVETREANEESFFRTVDNPDARKSRISDEERSQITKENNETSSKKSGYIATVYTASSEIDYRRFNPELSETSNKTSASNNAKANNITYVLTNSSSDSKLVVPSLIQKAAQKPFQQPHISQLKITYNDMVPQEDPFATSLPSQTSIVKPLEDESRLSLQREHLPSASGHRTHKALPKVAGDLSSASAEIFPPAFPPIKKERISVTISEHVDQPVTVGYVVAIVFGVLLTLVVAAGGVAFYIYNRETGIRPKVLSSDRSCANSDSGGYLDDQCRVAYVNSQVDITKGSPEDLVSLDNDSFLNSLESMTIQNLWTDSIRHTKL